MAGEKRSIKPGRMVLASLLVLAMVCVSLVCVSCEDLNKSSSTASSGGEAVPPWVTQSGEDPSAEPTATQPGETDDGTSTSVAAPDVLLDENDFGRQVKLQVGDFARVDLPARPTEKGDVTSVEWTYSSGGVVRQVDAGTSATDGSVTACWLEVEAIAPGYVTIRAIYVHEGNTTHAKWVVYLVVVE